MVFTTSKSWQWPWFRLSIWWICWSMGATSCPCAEDDSPRKIGWLGTKSGCVCVWKWDIPMYTQNWHCFAWKHDDEQADFMDFLPKIRNVIWIWWGYNQQSNSSCLQRSPKLSFYACFFMIYHKSADSCNIQHARIWRGSNLHTLVSQNDTKARFGSSNDCSSDPTSLLDVVFFLANGSNFPYAIVETNLACNLSDKTSWQQEKPDNWVVKPLCDEKHVLSIPR